MVTTHGLGLPVFVIAQEVAGVPVVHRGFQEQPAYAQMSHLLEAAVRRIDTATNDAEAFALNLLAEQVVFGKENLFMKSAKLAELFQIEEHEHARGKRMMKTREVLEEIVTRVKKFVEPTAALAQDVRGHAMQLFALS